MSYQASASIFINAPIETVWDGLTQPKLVKQYFFGTDLKTTWEIGTPIVFTGEWEGKAYEDHGEVLSYDAPNSLSYTYWSGFAGKPDIPENYQTVTYTVEQKLKDVRVTILQIGAETQESADHSSDNWLNVLQALKKLIEQK